ncbi:MAG: cold shock domain-containing protein [Waterburya sp.]
MKPVLHSGQLIKWKDDRGFGFIKPNDGGKEVFLHISALEKTNRRPQVGDTILYERVVEADGKIRATNALIQGIAIRNHM